MRGVVWAVIRREYLQRVRSKWFVFATLAAPIFMIGVFVVPALLASRGQETQRRIAVVDRTGVLYERLQERLEGAGYTVERIGNADEGDLEALDGRIADGTLGAYLVLDAATLERGAARYRSDETPSTLRAFTLRQAIAQAALEERLGVDEAQVRALLAGGELDVDLLVEGAGELDQSTFFAAYVGAFLLYMVILLYAVSIMRSVLEEKTSRVVEVVLSSMRPFHLMLGKILGVGAVGLTQLAIWVGFGALLAGMGIPMMLAANPELVELAELRDVLPGVGYVALFLVYFVGGYFIFSGLYAAVGAMCSTDEEAQQAQFPVMLLLIVPVIFVMQVIQEPDATLSVVLSLIPFFTPILMFGRAVAGSVPVWQIGLSIVLMGLAVLAIAWLAGRIYKVGILMAGKRPTLPELLRWVREA